MIAVTVLSAVEAGAAESGHLFPKALSDYAAVDSVSLLETLHGRIQSEPFNLAATVIFLLAIIHTFLTAKFRHWAHECEREHAGRGRFRREFRRTAG
jgi:2C-methyl-D-erythritol 2,4-cyclodiphosphate synthase